MLHTQLTYSPLLRLSVKHSYYKGGQCSDLRFLPTPSTAYWLNKLQLVIKKNTQGFMIGMDNDRKDALLYHLTENPSLKLSFFLYSQDNYFYNFTDIDTQQINKAVFYASNMRASWEQDICLLHPKKYLDENDLFIPQENLDISPDEGKLLEIYDIKNQLCLSKNLVATNPSVDLSELSAGFYHYEVDKKKQGSFFYTENIAKKPAALIDIFLNQEQTGIFSDEQLYFRDYQICFSHRKTFWKYFIVPQNNTSRYFSIECENINFNKAEAIRLEDGREAFLISSQQALSLQAFTPYYLELKKHLSENTEGRIVLRRMPVPSVSAIQPDRSTGRVYSEIFVYL